MTGGPDPIVPAVRDEADRLVEEFDARQLAYRAVLLEERVRLLEARLSEPERPPTVKGRRDRTYDIDREHVDPGPETVYDDPLLEAVLDDAVVVVNDWWSAGFADGERARGGSVRHPRALNKIKGSRLRVLAVLGWEAGLMRTGATVNPITSRILSSNDRR